MNNGFYCEDCRNTEVEFLTRFGIERLGPETLFVEGKCPECGNEYGFELLLTAKN